MRSNNTFSILFYVKKHRANSGEVPTYARITVDKKRVVLSIKRRVALERWDENRGMAKGNRQGIKMLNVYLEQVRTRLYECQQQLELERRLVTAEAIKSRYLGHDDRGKTLKELVEYHNEEMKGELSWGTQKNHFTTQHYVYEFEKKKRNISDIYLDKSNYKFIKDFVKYILQRQPVRNQSFHYTTRWEDLLRVY